MLRHQTKTCRGWKRKMRENSGLEARNTESGEWGSLEEAASPSPNQVWGLGERSKLPGGLGWSPRRSRIWCICILVLTRYLAAAIINDFRENQSQ